MFDRDWDDINSEANYFDFFNEEEQPIKAVDLLIDYITLTDQTEIMCKLFKKSLLYDLKNYPDIYLSTWAGQIRYERQKFTDADSIMAKPTKTFYKAEAKKKNLIVVRRTFNEHIDSIVKEISVGLYDDHEFYSNIVIRSELLDRLCTLINKEEMVDLDAFYQEDNNLKTHFLKIIEPITNGALKRRLKRLF